MPHYPLTPRRACYALLALTALFAVLAMAAGCRTVNTTLPNGTSLTATSLLTDLQIQHASFPTTRPTPQTPDGAPFVLDGYTSRSDMTGADITQMAATIAKAVAAAATQPQPLLQPPPTLLLLPAPQQLPATTSPRKTPSASKERLPQKTASPNPDVTVLFSPKGGAEAAMIAAIQKATVTVTFMDYTFNSPTLAKALTAAKRRGVTVEAILDASQRPPATQPTTKPTKPDPVQTMLDGGVIIRFDKHEPIMHNKWLIVDATSPHPTLFTGSKNMTVAGDVKNAENQLEIHNTTALRLIPAYLQNYQTHLLHSTP